MKNIFILLLFLISTFCQSQTCTLTASKNPVCIGDTVWLKATSSFTPSNYTYSGPSGFFNSSTSDSIKIITSSTSQSGNYMCVMSTISSTCIASVDFTVQPLPLVMVFSNSPNTGCQPICMSFSCSSSSFLQTINWLFGNSFNTTSAIATTCFTNSGIYTNSVNVTDISGCKNSSTFTTQIFPKPVAQIITSSNSVCALSAMTFTGMGGNSYYWDFGGGGTSSSQFPVQTFSTNGVYNVTLIVTDTNGCKDTLVTPITTLSLPSPTVYSSHIPNPCLTPTVCVEFFCSANTTIQYSNWSFGNGQTSTSTPSAVTCYTSNGIYFVKDSVSDINGCIGVSIIAISISTVLPGYNFTYTVGINGAVTFSATAFPWLSYSWNFTAPNQSTLANTTFVFPDTTQNYNVCLNFTENTCIYTICHQIIFNSAIGIKENRTDDLIKIYPNPVNDFLIIEPNKFTGTINIYNAKGNAVLEDKLDGKEKRLNLTNLSNGLYFIRLANGEKILFSKKIIKE